MAPDGQRILERKEMEEIKVQTKRSYAHDGVHYEERIVGTEVLHSDTGPARITGETEEWFRFGVRHRDGDFPAYKDTSAQSITTGYYKNGKRHRESGPAFEYCCGDDKKTEWYLHGSRHSVDGPAFVERSSSHSRLTSIWYMYDKKHRVGAPAETWVDDPNSKWPGGRGERWYQDGLLHNLDGPAHSWVSNASDGSSAKYQKYYLYDYEYTKELWEICRDYIKRTNLQIPLSPDKLLQRINSGRIDENWIQIDDLELFYNRELQPPLIMGAYISHSTADVLFSEPAAAVPGVYLEQTNQIYSESEYNRRVEYVCGTLVMDKEIPISGCVIHRGILEKYQDGVRTFRYSIPDGTLSWYRNGVLHDYDQHAALYDLKRGFKANYRFGKLVSQQPIRVPDALLKELGIERLEKATNSLSYGQVNINNDVPLFPYDPDTVNLPAIPPAATPTNQKEPTSGMIPFLLSGAALAGAAYLGYGALANKAAEVQMQSVVAAK